MKLPGKALALLGVAAMVLLSVGQAGAITFGVLDGNDHPNVGALIA